MSFHLIEEGSYLQHAIITAIEKGSSIQFISDMTEISKSNLELMVSGDEYNISYQQAEKLALILGLSPVAMMAILQMDYEDGVMTVIKEHKSIEVG